MVCRHITNKAAQLQQQPPGYYHSTAQLNAWREEFTREGYIVVRNFLPQQVLLRAQNDAQHFADVVAPTLAEGQVVYEDDGRIRHITDIAQHDPGAVWAQIAHSRRTVEIVEALLPSKRIGSSRGPPGTELFWKPGGATWIAPPHQDNAYVFLTHEHCDALAIWIALDDAPTSSGGLHYAAGSHKLGDLDHSIAPSAPFSKGMTAAAVAELEAREAPAYPWVSLEMRAGDCVVPSSKENVTVPKKSVNERFEFSFTCILISARLHGYRNLFLGVGTPLPDCPQILAKQRGT